MRSPSGKAGLVLLVALAPTLTAALGSTAQSVFSVAAFRSIQLQDGGEVIVRHGSTQRVTLVKGRRECSSVTVEDGELLIRGPHGQCRDEREMVIEVQTPAIEKLKVMDGGTLRTVGSFPSQEKLLGMVESGGRLDMRSMNAKAVRAGVRHGGGIFTKPTVSLQARIAQGGLITYWGDPDVQSRVEHGGAVTAGRPGDLNRPLEKIEAGVETGPSPPTPPTPPGGD